MHKLLPLFLLLNLIFSISFADIDDIGPDDISDNEVQLELTEDEKYADLRLKAIDKISEILDRNLEELTNTYNTEANRKYVTGGFFSLKAAILIEGKICKTTQKAEKPETKKIPKIGDKEYPTVKSDQPSDSNCKVVEKKQLPIADFGTSLKQGIQNIISKHFLYYLKRPLYTAQGNITATAAKIGTTEENPWEDFDLIGVNKSDKAFFARDNIKISIKIINHMTAKNYLRTDKESIDKVAIALKTRKTVGKVVYARMGPGLGQTDIIEMVDIVDNKSTGPLTNVVTGDYYVTAKNIFCGCDVDLDEDKVLDTRSRTADSTTQFEHYFPLEVRENTIVNGRLVEDTFAKTPIADAMIDLVPACSEADQCMKEVVSVKTDKDGKFTFENVPKGGYKVIHKGEEVGEISNCDLQAPQLNAGDFKVKKPVCQWDVTAKGIFKGKQWGGRQSYNYTGSLTWNNMVFETDPDVDCSKHLPLDMNGMKLLNHRLIPPESTGDFPTDDSVFLSLITNSIGKVAPFYFSMNVGQLPNETNCGLWPAPIPCAVPDLYLKLQKGKKFEFTVVNDQLYGLQMARFTYTFTPSLIEIEVPETLDLDIPDDNDDDDGGYNEDEWENF